ncbi:MAG: protein kinase family protein [Gemmatimonadota bacterium]
MAGGGLVAGRYRLEEQAGEQDGSVVWRATDVTLCRDVTVRTFAPGCPRTAAVIAAARAVAKLNDARLAQVYDADSDPACPYVVTEWAPGSSLSELLRTGPLTPPRAAQLVAGAADALAGAHAAGLWHLCLAPGSLWVSQWGEVKITGLATVAALTSAEASDPAQADTRGLAGLLYAALTGYWPGPEPTGLPPAPCPGGRVAPPGQLRAGIPVSLDSVTCRALYAEAQGEAPPILGPAQLARELTAIIRTGPPGPVPEAMTASAWPDPPPAATLPQPPAVTVADPQSVTVPQPPVPQPPVPQRPAPQPPAPQRAGPPQPGPPQPGPPPVAPGAQRPRPARRARSRRTLLTRAGLLLGLAVLAAAGWLLARGPAGSRPPPAEAAGPVRVLVPASAVPFAIQGSGQGDNGQLAPLAIDRSPGTAWHTDWYTTERFGNLTTGTGLLLDLGRPATVTAARITLGSYPGASLQLRAGSAASLAGLKPVAYDGNASGQVWLRPGHPVPGRYLLLWFTRLPPDGHGTFQADVYDVRLQGQG